MGVKFIKKILITSILLVFIIFSISSAQATEITDNTTEIIKNTDDTINLTQGSYESDYDNPVLEKNYAYDGEGNLTKYIITSENNNIIERSKSYNVYSINESTLKSFSIEGVINYDESSGEFSINQDNTIFIFEKCTFEKEIEFNSIGGSSNQLNITLLDCELVTKDNISQCSVVIKEIDVDEKSYSSTPTSEIKKLAESIVGKSTGMDAIKKLGYWVKNNIAHEVGTGFYQSPSETLKRKIGNCCCHSELFLQMCVALKLDKEFKLSYVHVGNMAHGYRHYFVLVDNICVDTDGSKDNPFFYGGGLDWGVYEITEYPLRPYT